MTKEEFNNRIKKTKEMLDRDIIRLQKISSMIDEIDSVKNYDEFDESIDRIVDQLEVVIM